MNLEVRGHKLLSGIIPGHAEFLVMVPESPIILVFAFMFYFRNKFVCLCKCVCILNLIHSAFIVYSVR